MAVVSDDLVARAAICRALANQGYRSVEIESPEAPETVVARLRPVVVLFDLDRGDRSGLVHLVHVRDVAPTTPLIAMSASVAEGDKVTALDLGADDYMSKPVGTSELLARIRVALRHLRMREARPEVVEVGAIRIDPARYEVTIAGVPIHLTPIEFRLLELLASRAETVVGRQQLLDTVWGPGTDQAHYLRVHIAALRRKIEEDPRRPRRLETVTGIGYRLRA